MIYKAFLLFWSFMISNFDIVSDFEIRISNLIIT